MWGWQCFRLRTNLRKFTPKSSDLLTYYLPGGQTDAEVFVERNIDISSIYEAILYLFQFQNKNGRFPAVDLSLRMRGIKRSRGYEVTHAHSGYSVTKFTKGRKIFYRKSRYTCNKTALKVSCIV